MHVVRSRRERERERERERSIAFVLGDTMYTVNQKQNCATFIFAISLVFNNSFTVTISKRRSFFLFHDVYCLLSQVSLARPSSDNIKGANLYVSGLPRSMTQIDMDELFAPYGNIVTSRILCDLQTGKTTQALVTTTIRLQFDRATTILRYGLPVVGCCTAA